jgi:hypothetical protein
METLAMIRQMFLEESMSCTLVFELKSPNSPRTKKGQTGEKPSQDHAHRFL